MLYNNWINPIAIISFSAKVKNNSIAQLINKRNNPVGNFFYVFSPEVAILCSAAFVVIRLPRKQQGHIIEWVEPRPKHGGLANGEHNAGGHANFAQIIYVAA